MADEFSERYGDLLKDYFPLGHNPGRFRMWWRRLHGGGAASQLTGQTDDHSS